MSQGRRCAQAVLRRTRKKEQTRAIDDVLRQPLLHITRLTLEAPSPRLFALLRTVAANSKASANQHLVQYIFAKAHVAKCPASVVKSVLRCIRRGSSSGAVGALLHAIDALGYDATSRIVCKTVGHSSRPQSC